MRRLLSRDSRKRLWEFVEEPKVLLAFDFDGTLAPIVPSRKQARMRRQTRALLSAVSRLYPCAVISGRARKDVRERVGLGSDILYVGNHGIEWGTVRKDDEAARLAREWQRALRQRLRGMRGIAIENKGPTLAVHYRDCADWAGAERLIREASGGLRGARLVGGKAVMNLVPKGSCDKGSALLRLKKALRCERAFFIGDDLTDEDAFRACREDRGLLGVRVGPDPRSAARYYVETQEEIDEVLEILREARLKG